MQHTERNLPEYFLVLSFEEIGHLSIIPQKVAYGMDTHCHCIRLDVYVDEENAGIFDLVQRILSFG